MAYSDRREPGVYVSIEDKSYAPEAIESGRSVYSVILCDRGPSDQIVRVRSQEQFQRTFGQPNFLRTSQTHYMVNAALKYTGDVLVTRVVPEDAAWSNTGIQENTTGDLVKAYFDFVPGSKEVRMSPASGDTMGSGSLYSESESLLELAKVQLGSWIYPDGAESTSAVQVVGREEDSETKVVSLTIDRPYEGTEPLTGQAYVFVPFSEVSLADVNDSNLFTNPDGSMVFYFYAFGAGKVRS